MKRLIIIAIALCCFAAGTAFADVSDELVVGLEGDSTSEATNSNGADLKDQFDDSSSLFTVQYTHYFSPLVDDEHPIDLRRFYQHPSTLSAGLAFFGSTEKDNTVPSDAKTSASALMLGGEYFFPTNTGLFLDIQAGSGTTKETVGGTAQPDVDIQVSQSDLGVRQYLGGDVALALRFHSESTESQPSGLPESTVNKDITYLGVQGVIKDVVGLKLEFGGGKREDKSGGFTTSYDIGAANFEIAGYIGKQLSVRLGLEADVEEMTGRPSGFEYSESTVRSTLAARYWFSERFGMELPIYAETTEQRTVVPLLGEYKETVTSSGMGLYASFRF